MKIFIRRLKVKGFKNLAETECFPSERFNLITGNNAQGKTNFIEAIWIMTGCRSFRGTRERDFIGFDSSCAEICLEFQNSIRTQNIVMRMCRGTKERKILLNGIECHGGKKLFEQFQCIAFLPSDIELADGTPDKRRVFTDICCSQLRPSVIEYIKRYSLILANRNAVLKSISAGKSSRSQLDVWNEQLAQTGAYLSLVRKNYAGRLNSVAGNLYSGITAGTEKLDISYHSGIYPPDYRYPEKADAAMRDIYISRLEDTCDDDIRLGYTQYGTHRDDLMLEINGLPVRTYGSQGQKKSSSLVMKLAQADILRHEKGESPVILLDDVMGELDESRQNLVSRIIDGMQVFITSCNAESVKTEGNRLYCMKKGILSRI